MAIFFNEITLKTRFWKNQLIKATKTVLSSGKFLQGEQNSLLEDRLKKYLKGGNVTTVASGHDALFLSLQALNLRSNDEIIFPVNSYPTAFPIVLSKAKPIPCDVDINGQIDFNCLTKKISKRVKVIVIVHLYGLVGELEKIRKLALEKNIYLIEDCAQAFGTTFNKKSVGAFGDIGCFSFYPTKNLSTLGDGGAIWTKHKAIYKHMLKAKSYGENIKYKSDFIAGHSRLPEIQAAFINLFFENIENDNRRRKKVYQNYQSEIYQQNLDSFIRILESNRYSQPIPHLFIIECKNRNRLQKYLENREIKTAIHYPLPIHLVPAFKPLGYKKGDFPIAERLSKNILSMPFHSYLTPSQIKYIVGLLKKFYR